MWTVCHPHTQHYTWFVEDAYTVTHANCAVHHVEYDSFWNNQAETRATSDFSPQAWKVLEIPYFCGFILDRMRCSGAGRSNTCTWARLRLHRPRGLLQAARAQAHATVLHTSEGMSNSGSSGFVIVDDNMFYRSMRKKIFLVAKQSVLPPHKHP